MNNSSNNELGTELLGLPLDVVVPLVLLSSIISLTTIVANSVLIAVIVRTSQLHTYTNYLIISLAAGEIITGTFTMPFVCVSWVKQTWIFTERLCYFVGFMSALGYSVKSLSMVAVALDRCVAVSQPLQYTHIINKRSVAGLIAFLWIQSFTFAVLPILGWGRYSYLSDFYHCVPDFYHSVSFSVVSSVFCYIVPSTVVILASIVIHVEARSHHRVIAIAQLTVAMYSGLATEPGLNFSRSTMKAMRAFFLIIFFYLVLCIPRQFCTLYFTVNQHIRTREAILFANVLSFICCVITPLIISTANRKFKDSIRVMFKSKNRVQPIPVGETEAFFITTGLHSALDASLAEKCVPSATVKRFDLPVPGPSFNNTVSVQGPKPRDISVLTEVQTSGTSPSGQSQTGVYGAVTIEPRAPSCTCSAASCHQHGNIVLVTPPPSYRRVSVTFK